jgi:hypothetical protein
MNDPVPPKPICRRCTAVLDADDNYCRRCGAPTPFGVKSGIAPSAKQPAVWDSPWVILPLLFLVLGPLALPLLWSSRRFTFLWKSILTAIVLGMTVLLIWATWFITQNTLAQLQQALDIK